MLRARNTLGKLRHLIGHMTLMSHMSHVPDTIDTPDDSWTYISISVRVISN